MTDRYTIAVLGAGPAGLAVAVALAGQGLDVVVVSPDPEARWIPRYGAWADEIEGLDLGGLIERRWDEVLAWTRPEEPVQLRRSYVRFDRDGLRRHLLSRCAAAGVQVRAGGALAVTPTAEGRHVAMTTGELRCRCVVDATGALSRFVAYPKAPALAVQTAWGILARVDGYDETAMTLMDWRPADAKAAVPSFLYAQPLGPGLAFFEETVLAATPAVAPEVLRDRLTARLAARRIRVREVLDVERCFIAMNPPVPVAEQLVVPFGAAASFVHPSTGYTLTRTLRQAPLTAEIIARSLKNGVDPGQAVMASSWSGPRRAVRRLHGHGLDVVLAMPPDEVPRFFDLFFAQSLDVQQTWLNPEASLSETTRAMATMFRQAPLSLKARLAAGSWFGVPPLTTTGVRP